jgi:NAD(P)-dependent dehydrogenase (short-subunit alcohol dehydrogenase family)
MQFAYNSAKAAVTHLTKMMATEFTLKKIPVRVCGVAPGVYRSDMTKERLRLHGVDMIAQGIFPTPAKRAGK